MLSIKFTKIAGRSTTTEKKGKEYLRISPLHRRVLQTSYNRRKMVGPPRRTPLPTTKATSSDNPKVTDTPKLPAHEPDDAPKSSSSADTAEQTPQRRRRAGGAVSEFGPAPEFPEELARQWGWTDDSWKYMALHRLTSRGWVRMREPIDDFERSVMGLPPLPPDVVEVRLEERRKEDLEMLMKRHGVKPQGTCGKCRENGLTVSSPDTLLTASPWLTVPCSAMVPVLLVPHVICGV